MKKLITIFALLFLTVGVFAQTAKVEGTPETLKDNLSHDVLEFIMTSNVTNEEVDNSAQYYTEYFTVDYNSESHKATINFIENSIKSRRKISISVSHTCRTLPAAGLSNKERSRCSTVINSWRFSRASLKARFNVNSSSLFSIIIAPI
jgi:hypothetical protein